MQVPFEDRQRAAVIITKARAKAARKTVAAHYGIKPAYVSFIQFMTKRPGHVNGFIYMAPNDAVRAVLGYPISIPRKIQPSRVFT